MKDMIFTQDEIQDLLRDVQTLVADIGWEYERMSRCGKDTYDELCEKLGIE